MLQKKIIFLQKKTGPAGLQNRESSYSGLTQVRLCPKKWHGQKPSWYYCYYKTRIFTGHMISYVHV